MLWLDTNQDPPQLKRYDSKTKKWYVTIATQDSIANAVDGRYSLTQLKRDVESMSKRTTTPEGLYDTVSSSQEFQHLLLDLSKAAQDLITVTNRIEAAEQRITKDAIVSTVTNSNEYLADRQIINGRITNSVDLIVDDLDEAKNTIARLETLVKKVDTSQSAINQTAKKIDMYVRSSEKLMNTSYKQTNKVIIVDGGIDGMDVIASADTPCTITYCGKNIFKGALNSTKDRAAQLMEVMPGHSYAISGLTTQIPGMIKLGSYPLGSQNLSVAVKFNARKTKTSTKQQLNVRLSDTGSYVVDVPSNCYYLQFESSTPIDDWSKIQIEPGETSTDYERYHSSSIVIKASADGKGTLSAEQHLDIGYHTLWISTLPQEFTVIRKGLAADIDNLTQSLNEVRLQLGDSSITATVNSIITQELKKDKNQEAWVSSLNSKIGDKADASVVENITKSGGTIDSKISALTGKDGAVTKIIDGLSTQNGAIWQANQAAANAQSSANSKNKTYCQAAAPTGATTGDLWINTTNNANSLHRWNGSTWVKLQDSEIASAASAASAAQSTANKKITTYCQDESPKSDMASGDLWIKTKDNVNTLHRWNGKQWVQLQDAGIGKAQSAASSAQSIAKGKITTFCQGSPAPTAISVGDLWINTEDKNKLSRWNGTSWVAIRDTDIQQALNAANAAQNDVNLLKDAIGDESDEHTDSILYRLNSAESKLTDTSLNTTIAKLSIIKSMKQADIVVRYSQPKAQQNVALWYCTNPDDPKYGLGLWRKTDNGWVQDSNVEYLKNNYTSQTQTQEAIWSTVGTLLNEGGITNNSANPKTQAGRTTIKQSYRDYTVAVKNVKDNIDSYMNFSDKDGLILGKSDSNFKAQLTNEKLAFKENSEDIAYISNKSMYITNARITEQLSLGVAEQGYFDWQVSDEGVGLKWRTNG